MASLIDFHPANANTRISPPIALPPITNINPARIASATIITLQSVRRVILTATARVRSTGVVANVD
jgi:hypothetical protein